MSPADARGNLAMASIYRRWIDASIRWSVPLYRQNKRRGIFAGTRTCRLGAGNSDAAGVLGTAQTGDGRGCQSLGAGGVDESVRQVQAADQTSCGIKMDRPIRG